MEKKKKKKEDKMPYKPTPSSESFSSQPESCYEIINKYGTYNIQPTVDSENDFPAIGYTYTEKRNTKKK